MKIEEIQELKENLRNYCPPELPLKEGCIELAEGDLKRVKNFVFYSRYVNPAEEMKDELRKDYHGL